MSGHEIIETVLYSTINESYAIISKKIGNPLYYSLMQQMSYLRGRFNSLMQQSKLSIYTIDNNTIWLRSHIALHNFDSVTEGTHIPNIVKNELD